jgi:hypothetical protein
MKRPASRRAKARPFIDPWRRIVSVEEGFPFDRLTLSCGHLAVEKHQRVWGTDARCHHCRQYLD